MDNFNHSPSINLMDNFHHSSSDVDQIVMLNPSIHNLLIKRSKLLKKDF
jgi:hypothetical protein